MVAKQSEPKNLGVLMIDFSPVVREGLQSILTKDTRIAVIGDALDENEAILHIKRPRLGAVKWMVYTQRNLSRMSSQR
jgi:DNA-binding NarL/FixJ family response regulator